MGTQQVEWGSPALHAALLGRAQRRQPPIRWVLLGRCCSLVLFTWLWSVSRRDRCVPGPQVRSTWLHIWTSRCSVKPVGPPGWFQSCHSGAQEGQSGQWSTLFGDHWLLQTPSLPGVTALELPHSLQGQVQLPGMEGICPLPQGELAGLAAVLGKHNCPSAALTEHLPCAEAALPGAECGHTERGLMRQVWVPAQPLWTARGGGRLGELGGPLRGSGPPLLPERGGRPRTDTLSSVAGGQKPPEGV